VVRWLLATRAWGAITGGAASAAVVHQFNDEVTLLLLAPGATAPALNLQGTGDMVEVGHTSARLPVKGGVHKHQLVWQYDPAVCGMHLCTACRT
jgi:hypothetical protein